MTAVEAPAAVPRAPAWWMPWSAPGATLVYTALAIVLTWPLSSALTRSLPADLGDPALNAWILAWSSEHLRLFLSGHLGAFHGYWNANIFHPEPLALAYSEHLFAQAAQVLPAWALTRNPILCYNLLFLSTFVVAGLGTFLLVRDLTGDPRAAFVAGVAFAFAPYRISQLSHLQVLSSGWMPFVLYALRRHLSTARLSWLAVFVAAFLLQNLSCGYYLVFFGPFVAAFAALEIAARWAAGADAPAGRVQVDAWAVGRVALGFGLVGLGTWPFLSPYLELRGLGFPPRALPEVISFSANAWSYVQAPASQWLWGSRLSVFEKSEGELFPGLVALTLALVALGATWATARRSTPTVVVARWRTVAATLAASVAAVGVATALATLPWGEWILRAGHVVVRGEMERAIRVAALGVAAWLLVSPFARGVARRLARSAVVWCVVATLAAVVLSFGPQLDAGPRTLVERAPYRWLYDHVPGFDGLRVPSRYAMLVELGLAVLCGYGVVVLLRKTSRPSTVAAACALALIVEGGSAPLPLDRPLASGALAPPSSLPLPSDPPPVYTYIGSLPAGTVVCELPFGSEAWDIRYLFASTIHGQRLVNGYSGGFPVSYYANVAAFRDVARDPDAAWRRLAATGTTVVVVHEGAFPDRRGIEVTAWLVARGARLANRFGDDVVLRLPAAGLE